VLDAIAAARRAGALDDRGGFRQAHPAVTGLPAGPATILAPSGSTSHGREIALTRADVGEIQLAKAAIRAGTELLLSAADTQAAEIDEVIIAGAFGTYLDIDSAVTVGMLPSLAPERYRQVGNAAGLGAQQMLVSRTSREKASRISQLAQYVELTTHPGFADAFAEQLMFPPVPSASATPEPEHPGLHAAHNKFRGRRFR